MGTSWIIVNSSGSKMTMGGGLTRAIREAGGDVIRDDAQTKLPMNIGDAVVTTAGRLRQKYVFHCITIAKSIDHSNTPEGVSDNDIHQYIIGRSIDKCFLLLHAMGLTSIAFPAIGAGAVGIPFKKVAEVMTEAIGRNLRKTNKSFNVEIHLYDRFEKMNQWDFLPMFEQFSAQEAIARMLSEQASDRLFADDASGTQSAEAPPIWIRTSLSATHGRIPRLSKLSMNGSKRLGISVGWMLMECSVKYLTKR